VDGEPNEIIENEVLTKEQEDLISYGKNNKQDISRVTVSVHVTKSFRLTRNLEIKSERYLEKVWFILFRDSFSSESAMEAFLHLAVEESNQVY